MIKVRVNEILLPSTKSLILLTEERLDPVWLLRLKASSTNFAALIAVVSVYPIYTVAEQLG